MKFMKLGSKPDQFQSDGENCRYVASELATDVVIVVADVKFYLHKFPLLSKSSLLQKLVADSSDDDEIVVTGIPGGAPAFEICVKFCYGMVVTLNAYNVVAARCAAEFLGMHESVEKGNLAYKIDVFMSSSIFRSWKDSIILLHSTKHFLPWAEELKIVGNCVDSIAVKASTEPSKVEWSYTYNRKKLPSENGHDSQWNGVVKQQTVPDDWWVEDLCELPLDLYKEIIATIRANGDVSASVIGESLKAYASKRLPDFSHGTIQSENAVAKLQCLVNAVSSLLPEEKNSAQCGFLLKLLHASIVLECEEDLKRNLMQRISRQLDDATVSDLLFSSPNGEFALYNIDIVHELVQLFKLEDEPTDVSKARVARLVDGYLAEAARDPALPSTQFVNLAELISGFPRSSHDGLYRAIDMYLKEHPDLSKSEKRRICRLIDSGKLSGDACAHAVQNERLPLRMVVHILFLEQSRSASSNGKGSSFPRGSSCGSSRSGATNPDEYWESYHHHHHHHHQDQDQDQVGGGDKRRDKTVIMDSSRSSTGGDNKAATPKRVKKMFSRLWSHRDRPEENTSSDTSDSPASTSTEETNEMMMKVAGQIANQMQKKLQLTR